MAKENPIPQAVILVGGKGTRLRPLTYDIPKPMVPVGDTPFLEYLVRLLAKEGIKEIVFCAGYLHEHIVNHFGDGEKFGVQITYSIEDGPLGTGGALKLASQHLKERFFFLYGDSYYPIDYCAIAKAFIESGRSAGAVAYDNSGIWVAENNILAEEGMIKAYDKSLETKGLNGVEAGVLVLQKSILAMIPDGVSSLENEVFNKLIEKEDMFGLLSSQRFYDIGTPDRLEMFREFLRLLLIVAASLMFCIRGNAL